MKKYIITALLSLAALYGTAQTTEIDRLFQSYTGRSEYTIMEFSGALLQMMTGGKEGGGDFSGVNAFRMLSTDKSDSVLEEGMIAAATGDGFTVLMNLSDGEDNFRIMFKPRNDSRDSRPGYLMIARDEELTLMVYLEGDVDFRNISKLSKLRDRLGANR
ncbi:MAG: DUF4252 domain-containing protein [Alistipes sp.]|nr:DUF4252 domain-containing protein [Alistipes sp.]